MPEKEVEQRVILSGGRNRIAEQTEHALDEPFVGIRDRVGEENPL